MNSDDLVWMARALDEARLAVENGELPIAAVITADGREIARAQTSPARLGTIVAHAEILALQATGWSIFSSSRPVVLYTTLEPCLMCLGAAVQCGIDRIVYGMKATVDGGASLASDPIWKGKLKLPQIQGGVGESESVSLMRAFIANNQDHLGASYVKELLVSYESK